MNERDNITSGPIARTVFSLALPVVLGMFMEVALTTINYFWVGRLGPTAQDAITSSMVVIWTIFASISIVTVGVIALVARHVGAKDLPGAVHFIRQGMTMAVLIGVVTSVVGFLIAPILLRFMDTGPATAAQAIPYLRVFFASATLFFVCDTSYAVFRASGDTRTPMKVGVFVVVTNMVLDPFLIFGWGPFPRLGVTGGSLATAIALFLGVVYIMYRMISGGLGYEVGNPFTLSPLLKSIGRIARIGLPSASQHAVFTLAYWFLIRIVHTYGESAGAAMGIGNRMESFSYLTCFGFSVAASTMVGQNLGAKQPERAERCAWGAAWSAVAITAVMSVLFITIPHLIARVFTDHEEVRSMAADYLIILGLSQMAMAVEIVLEGSFGGAGDTIPPMSVSIPGSLARIPLAYLLCFGLGLGLNGVWWSLTITTLGKAATLAFLFRRGRWKLKKV